MVDGLDGSGKGTVINALMNHLEKEGKKIIDLKEYCEKHNDFPEYEDIQDYEVIISREPTYSNVGMAIRHEMIRDNKRKYSGLSTAHAFALDREILYKKVLVPALEKGKIVIQDRGVISSIVYQPIQLEKISLRDIINIPGNRLAIKYAPSLLVITKVDPQVVIQRLRERDKKDHAIFEKLVFQRQISNRYESDWLKRLFEGRGSKVVYLDTNYPKKVEDTEKAAVAIWEDHKK